MDLDEIRAFLAVAETGSFAAAAKGTGFARATLRRRINELEARIGGELFDRSSDGATLTERGRVFASRAERVVAEATALVSSTRQVGKPVDNVFRMAIPREVPLDTATLGGKMLRASVPGLFIHTLLCDDPLRRIGVDADIAVVFGNDPPIKPPWRAVPGPPLLEGLYASTDYIERHGRPETLAALADHAVVGWTDGDRRADEVELRKGGRASIPIRSSTTGLALARELARSGDAIAYLIASGLPSPPWYRNELVPVLADVVGCEVPARIVVPAEIDTLPHARALRDMVENLVGSSAR